MKKILFLVGKAQVTQILTLRCIYKVKIPTGFLTDIDQLICLLDRVKMQSPNLILITKDSAVSSSSE